MLTYGGDQFSSGDGSLKSGGFLGSGYSLEPGKKKRGRPRKYSPVGDGGNVSRFVSGAECGCFGCRGGNLEISNDGTTNADVNVDLSVRKRKGRPVGSSKRQLDALGNKLDRDSGAGAEADSSSSLFFQKSQSYALMKQQMELAANSKDY